MPCTSTREICYFAHLKSGFRYYACVKTCHAIMHFYNCNNEMHIPLFIIILNRFPHMKRLLSLMDFRALQPPLHLSLLPWPVLCIGLWRHARPWLLSPYLQHRRRLWIQSIHQSSLAWCSAVVTLAIRNQIKVIKIVEITHGWSCRLVVSLIPNDVIFSISSPGLWIPLGNQSSFSCCAARQLRDETSRLQRSIS
jgi:hypothetical protein